MAHTPQHPQNPYSLNHNEQTPAKIWELLRRNEKFGRAVTKLRKLDLDEKTNNVTGLKRTSYRIIDALKKHNNFAAHALQWLVPEPEFRAWRVALSQDLDSAGRLDLDVVAEGHGTTPDPTDQANWTWEDFTKHRPRGAIGERFLRGPTVSRQICDDPRFSSKVDPFLEWREYFHINKSEFTLTTHWRDTPPGFRRDFCWLWRLRDRRASSPDTGLRHGAPEPFETDLFQNWRLGKALTQCCKTALMKSEDLAAVFQFEELAESYRVFAIPKHIPSRMAAREVADWLFEHLAVSLPAREPEFLGSPLQWDIFLTVEDLMRQGAPLDEAIQDSFDKLHLHGDEWHEGHPIPNQKKRWAQRGTNWQNSYRIMDSPVAGTGLIQQIFPGKRTITSST